MASAAGSAHSGTEQRSKPRRTFNYHASILVPGGQPFACAIADVSEGGARIRLAEECDLPERFILFLSKNGGARRHCQMIWRKGLFVGVKFPDPA